MFHMSRPSSIGLGILLVVGLLAPPTSATASMKTRVNACLKKAKSKAVGGDIQSVGRDGSHHAYHVTQGRRQALVFVPRSSGAACVVKGIGRADARAWGRFAKGEGKLKAYLLSAECKEGCGPAVLAVRNAKKQILAAKRLNATCTQGGTLSALTLFSPREQTLSLRCRAGSGGSDYIEEAILYQIRGGELRSLLSAPMGSGVTWTKGQQVCRSRAPGWVKAERIGPAPTLSVLQVKDQGGVGTVGALKVSYRYDPSRKSFVRTGTVKTTVAVQKKCTTKPTKTRPGKLVLAKPITLKMEDGMPTGLSRECVGVGSKAIYFVGFEDIPDTGGMRPDEAKLRAHLFRYALRTGKQSRTVLARADGRNRYTRGRKQLKKSLKKLTQRIKREKLRPCVHADTVAEAKASAHHKDAEGAFRASHPAGKGKIYVTVVWTEKHVYIKSSRAPKKLKRIGERLSRVVEPEEEDSDAPEELEYPEPEMLIYVPGTSFHALMYSPSEVRVIQFSP